MFASGPLRMRFRHLARWRVESTCVFDKPIQILSSTPHMHESGRFFRTELIRANGDVETVATGPVELFEQPMYDTPLQIEPGDALRTVCRLENTSAVSLHSGDTTEDEMCFNFMYHTPPIGALFCDTGEALEAPPIPEEEPLECLVEVVVPSEPVEASEILGAVPPSCRGWKRCLTETGGDRSRFIFPFFAAGIQTGPLRPEYEPHFDWHERPGR